MSKPLFFELVNAQHGVAVAQIQMTEELFENEIKNLIDPQNFTLRGLQRGGPFTLDPMEETEALVATLSNIFEQYQRYNFAFDSNLSSKLSQADAMIEAIGTLFHTTKYFNIETVKDLQVLIYPAFDAEHKVEKVEYSKLDKLIGEHGRAMNLNMQAVSERYLKALNETRAKVGLPTLKPVEDKEETADLVASMTNDEDGT